MSFTLLLGFVGGTSVPGNARRSIRGLSPELEVLFPENPVLERSLRNLQEE